MIPITGSILPASSIFSTAWSDTRITYDLVLEHTDVQAGPVSWAEQKELFEAVGAFVEEQQIQLVVTDTVMDPQGNYILNDYIQTNENDWIYERLRMTAESVWIWPAISPAICRAIRMIPLPWVRSLPTIIVIFVSSAETLRLHGLKELTGTENDSLLIFVDSAENGQKLQNFIDCASFRHRPDCRRSSWAAVHRMTSPDLSGTRSFWRRSADVRFWCCCFSIR